MNTCKHKWNGYHGMAGYESLRCTKCDADIADIIATTDHRLLAAAPRFLVALEIIANGNYVESSDAEIWRNMRLIAGDAISGVLSDE